MIKKFATIICATLTLMMLIYILKYNTYNEVFANDSKTIAEEIDIKKESLSLLQKSLIAHGGGALSGDTYLNCYDAIKYYYEKGIRLFELDVEYTSDGMPVMLHSWDGFQWKYLGLDRNSVCKYDEFKNAKMKNNYTQHDLESLSNYMITEFQEMYWITDTKADNKKLLSNLATNYPYLVDRVIPQVYNQNEYFYAKNLGFKNIIYTLYMSEDTDEQILDFCKHNDIFAITMPLQRVLDSELSQKLSELGVYVYTHTVNDDETYKTVLLKGVKGIYTDSLFS